MNNEPSDSTLPSQDDRIMAALSHISAVIPFMGVIAPIVIWATQKSRSSYVAFQSLQAVAFQLTIILAWFVGMGCYMCSAFSIFLIVPLAGAASRSGRTTALPLMVIPIIFPLIVFGGMIAGMVVFDIYSVIATVRSLQGKPFRYAILGRRIENFLKTK